MSSLEQSFRQLVRAARAMVSGQSQMNTASNEIRLDSGIPQAGVHEARLQSYELRDWRKYFSDQLQGKGLEIGPLHRPMLRHSGMDVDYIDRCTVAELREHYPELNELPLVEPTIIGDAETMQGIPDQQYDFLISAHVIEHMKNPLGSLAQWCRVVKPGGLLYLIVPDKRATFDKKRVRTTVSHMILDYQNPSSERDFEHYLDYAIHVHDKSGDAAILEAKRLIETDYSIHFHVFLPSDIIELLQWFSLNVHPLEIVEGPVMAPGSDEFHCMLRVGTQNLRH